MWGWKFRRLCKLQFGFVKEQKKVLKTPLVTKVIQTLVPQVQAEMSLFDFVIWGEWAFQYKAFCDDYYKIDWKLIRKKWKACGRWSIWYGTLSFWWEEITKEEGIRRSTKYLKNQEKDIPSCWTQREKVAIIDMQYQFWKYYLGLNKYVARCDYNSVKYILYPYGRYLKGVTKRRVRGYNYFLSK